MKITMGGDALNAALGWVSRLCPTRPVVPVLSGVLLEAGDEITASAFDFETAGTATMAGMVFDEGRALVSGRLLAAIAKTLKQDDEVVLESQGAALQVSCGSSSWSLPLMDEREYPQLPSSGAVLGEVDAEAFRAALGRVLPAVGVDNTVQSLMGVSVSADGEGGLLLVATDRYRLAVVTLDWKPAGDGELPAMTVPGELLKAAVAAAGAGTVRLASDGQTVSVVSDAHVVAGRLIADAFPRWRPLNEVAAATSIVVEVPRLLRAVERSVMVLEPSSPLRLLVGPDVQVSGGGQDSEASAAHSCPTVSFEGEGTEVGVKPAYLTTALAGAGTERVLITFPASPQRPILVQPADGEGNPIGGYRHIVMPIRLQQARAAA